MHRIYKRNVVTVNIYRIVETSAYNKKNHHFIYSIPIFTLTCRLNGVCTITSPQT